jgi:hypothetical protein
MFLHLTFTIRPNYNITKYNKFSFNVSPFVGSRKQSLTAVGIRCADHATRSIRKSWHYYFFIIVNGVRLNPLGTAATTGLLYQPQMVDDGDCGAIGGMKVGRRNRSTR